MLNILLFTSSIQINNDVYRSNQNLCSNKDDDCTRDVSLGSMYCNTINDTRKGKLTYPFKILTMTVSQLIL